MHFFIPVITPSHKPPQNSLLHHINMKKLRNKRKPIVVQVSQTLQIRTKSLLKFLMFINMRIAEKRHYIYSTYIPCDSERVTKYLTQHGCHFYFSPVWCWMCAIKSWSSESNSRQTQHSIVLSAACTAWCLFKLPFCANLFSHFLHAKGFCWMCTAWCLFRFPFVV